MHPKLCTEISCNSFPYRIAYYFFIISIDYYILIVNKIFLLFPTFNQSAFSASVKWLVLTLFSLFLEWTNTDPCTQIESGCILVFPPNFDAVRGPFVGVTWGSFFHSALYQKWVQKMRERGVWSRIFFFFFLFTLFVISPMEQTHQDIMKA